MRITRGSPPCTGEARGDVEWSPSCHPNMRTFLRHPEHGTKWSGGISSQVAGGEGIPLLSNFAPMGLVRRLVEMLLQAGISPVSVLRPYGARAPPRRNASRDPLASDRGRGDSSLRFGMTEERGTPQLRPVGARAPLRRNAPASRHFSYVGTSPLWSSCAASSKCSCKQAFLLCRYFAPLGLVRRLVEMLLQAGISPCVGRNDG